MLTWLGHLQTPAERETMTKYLSTAAEFVFASLLVAVLLWAVL